MECNPDSHSPWLSSSCSSTAHPGASGLGAVLITNLITAIINSQNNLVAPGFYPKDTTVFAEKYDFIVVGSGSAGSVVANRLTEISDWNVLVLEAGGDPPLTSDIPALFTSIQKTEADWQFVTEPQEFSCQGMKDKRCLWPRGKLLGGTSNLNGMIRTRGNKHDYDNWAAAGNEGWSYEDVLPYFKKYEDFKFHDENTEGFEDYSEEHHGKGGLLSIEPFRYSSPLMQGLIEAVKELGYSFGDRNGKTQSGFTIQHGFLVNGTRANTAKAFLAPIKNRKNFHVAKFAHVTKIVIDPKSKTVSGVEFIKDGKTHTVLCNKEVILSAGTINSAQLLMLSGVGPREHLEELNIPVIQDLKVGENLQDHVMVLAPTFKFNRTRPYSMDTLQILDATYEFLIHRRGPLSSVDVLQIIGFFSTKYVHQNVPDTMPKSSEELDYPDIEYDFIRYAYQDKESTKLLASSLGYTDEVYEAMLGIPNSEAEIFILFSSLQRPKSRGFIKLRSKDPKDPPLIDPKFLSDPLDIQTLVEGVKGAVAIGKAKILAENFEAELSTIKLPGCEAEEFESDDYWACVVKQAGTTNYHSVGTCKMGPRSDPDAVVDSRLKVHGIKGLRVIDGSIMPMVVTGNTHATIIMIGERGSDLIKEDWLEM